MSHDKYKVKLLLQRRVFRERNVRRRVVTPFAYGADGGAARDVTLFFEDASIRLAKPAARDGTQLLELACAQFRRVFREQPGVRCCVFCIDSHAPARKALVQRQRDAAMHAAAELAREQPLQYDGTRPLVALGVPLPPWARLRANPAARRAAINELVALVARHAALPPNCTLVLDWAGGLLMPDGAAVAPLVLRADAHGNMLAPYHDVRLAHCYGEADMKAQFYVRVARAGLEGVVPPGNAVLCSTDSDYIPLSLLSMQNMADDALNVYLIMSTVFTLRCGTACAKDTPGALRRYEMYDVRAVQRVVREVMRCESPLDFAVLCAMCGNDYVARPPPLTHEHLFAAFMQQGEERARDRLVYCAAPAAPPVVIPSAFVRLVRRALALCRNGGKKSALMRDERALRTYYVSVCWSLEYSLTGVTPRVYDAVWDKLDSSS